MALFDDLPPEVDYGFGYRSPERRLLGGEPRGWRLPPTPTPRQMQMQAYQTGAVPRGGGRGWQAGGAVGMKYGGGVRPTFPPIPPRGDPDRRPPPTPTLREMQMQAAHRGRGPGGWQAGGPVGYQGGGVAPGAARREYIIRNYLGKTRAHAPIGREWDRDERNKASHIQQAQRNLAPPGPRGWQLGGAVRPLPPILGQGYGPYINPPARFARGFAQGDLVEINKMREAINQLDPTIAIPYEGEDDPRWKWDQKQKLMAERDRLQQQLQTADEAMAQEIMAQIMEINKELEMAAAPGMAGGGVASLRGGGRPVDTRYAAYEARRRNRPPPQIGRALTPMGLNPSGFPYDPANQPLVARPIGPGGG